jgi:transcriptional regulator with XRE-family HTH domain
MKRADLNQSAVAKLAGRHRSTTTRWLSGEHQPDYEAAASFATALAQQRPDLGELALQFLAAAGYASTAVSGEASPVEHAISVHNGAHRALEDLRQLAHEQDKTIGDILVERGLASPEELTLSDTKRHDPIVKEILESDLSEETKNSILMAYVEQRRGHFRQAGAE